MRQQPSNINNQKISIWFEWKQIYASFFTQRDSISTTKMYLNELCTRLLFYFFTLFIKPLAIFNLKDKRTQLSIKRKLDQVRKKLLSLVQIIASLLISEFEAWSDSKTMFDIFQPNVSSFLLVHQLSSPLYSWSP